MIYCIGNGLSRIEADLRLLSGTTYGCNALYRNFVPDHLIACDRNMVEEILEAGINTNIYTRPRWAEEYGVKSLPALSMDWGSGMSALYLAFAHGHQSLHLIGYDMEPGNVYHGTRNYGTRSPRTHLWEKQLETMKGLVDIHFVDATTIE